MCVSVRAVTNFYGAGKFEMCKTALWGAPGETQPSTTGTTSEVTQPTPSPGIICEPYSP